MIIKKKYTNIKKHTEEKQEVVSEIQEFQAELDAQEITKEKLPHDENLDVSKLDEIPPSALLEDVDNLSGESFVEEKQPEKQKKKRPVNLDLSMDDLTFEQREERREGSRRRGYRRTQDRNIVSRAQKDAQSIKEIAKQDGYKEGIEKAQQDIDEIKEKFGEFYNYKNEVFSVVSECVLEVAVEIAKKIINKEIETDKTAILSIIKGVVEDVNKTEDKITLKVMPKDVELVRDKLPELFSGNSFDAKISVVPDNNIKEGGVIVETSNGIIDATIETQLAIMEKALRKQEES